MRCIQNMQMINKFNNESVSKPRIRNNITTTAKNWQHYQIQQQILKQMPFLISLRFINDN